MNAVRTELQNQQRAQRAKLVKLQQDIAAGRPPEIEVPEGKNDIPEYHPTIPNFFARIYRSGRAVWVVGYRTKKNRTKITETIGNLKLMPLGVAEEEARAILAEVPFGRDPKADRVKRRLRPKRTVGELCEEFFQEKEREPEPRQYALRTINGYRSVAKWYLDILRDMHFAELTPQDVSTRVREISNQRDRELDDHQHGELGAGGGGPWSAQQFRAMLSSVYKWAISVYPNEVKVNPVTGTWSPEPMPSTGQSFTMEELGVIWRACESLDANTVPMCRNGHAFKPGEHITDASDDEVMSCREAARVTGLHLSVFMHATKDGRLPYQVGEVETKKLGMRPAHLVTVGDVNRFLDSRPQRSQRGDYSKVVRLLMLLGARFGEIGGLRWSELECNCAKCRKSRRKFPFRFLHIPTVLPDGTRVPKGKDLRRIKNRKGAKGKPKDLVLYLPQAALDIIDSVQRRDGCDLLFGPADGSGALSNGALKNDLDAAIIEENEGAPLPYPNWKHHWLRHSFETHLEEDDDIECPPWLVAAMVNHSTKNLSTVEGDYTHAVYLQQQRRYLDIWANHVLDAAHPDEVKIADNVTQLRPAESA